MQKGEYRAWAKSTVRKKAWRKLKLYFRNGQYQNTNIKQHPKAYRRDRINTKNFKKHNLVTRDLSSQIIDSPNDNGTWEILPFKIRCWAIFMTSMEQRTTGETDSWGIDMTKAKSAGLSIQMIDHEKREEGYKKHRKVIAPTSER